MWFSPLYIIVIAQLFASSLFAQDLHFKEQAGEVQLWQQDRHIYSYQTATNSKDGQYPRANYVHPLNDFKGDALTEDFPEDTYTIGVFFGPGINCI